eukprot:3564868-Rhodomonas_salina.1
MKLQLVVNVTSTSVHTPPPSPAALLPTKASESAVPQKLAELTNRAPPPEAAAALLMNVDDVSASVLAATEMPPPADAAEFEVKLDPVSATEPPASAAMAPPEPEAEFCENAQLDDAKLPCATVLREGAASAVERTPDRDVDGASIYTRLVHLEVAPRRVRHRRSGGDQKPSTIARRVICEVAAGGQCHARQRVETASIDRRIAFEVQRVRQRPRTPHVRVHRTAIKGGRILHEESTSACSGRVLREASARAVEGSGCNPDSASVSSRLVHVERAPRRVRHPCSVDVNAPAFVRRVAREVAARRQCHARE